MSPLLLLILLRSRDRNHVLEELSDVENDSCSRMCRGLALACLSILMLHIPEACTRIAESLLDVSCIIFTQGIEFFRDYFILSASTAVLDEPNSARHSLFNLERQNSIQAFSDAYGDQQQGLISFYSLECIKEAAGAADETVRSVVQLIASLIDIMLRKSGHGNTEGSASSDCALLCIEKLIDENTDLVPSISLCLLAPVAAWLHYLAHTIEIDWLAVSTACNLWNAAAASVISNTDATILDSHTQDSSVSTSLELATLALRRVVSMQPPQNLASDVVVAFDNCTAAFRALSSTMFTSGISAHSAAGTVESAVDLTEQCKDSLPSHVRCGALLRLQNLLLDDWQVLTPDEKDSILRTVQTCIFDTAAAIYVAAVEVLCSIGRVDPAAAFSFGSKFLSTVLTEVRLDSRATRNVGLNSEKDSPKQNFASSRDLAICKLLDALGDVVRILNDRAHIFVLFHIRHMPAPSTLGSLAVPSGAGLAIHIHQICQHRTSSIPSTSASSRAPHPCSCYCIRK